MSYLNLYIFVLVMFSFLENQGNEGVYFSFAEARLNPDKVKELILTDPKLKDFDSIFIFRNIEKLFISEAKFDSLPNTVCNITSLKILGLYNCKINHLPDSLGNLRNLENLLLFSTPINSIPRSLYLSGNLKLLFIFNTEINDKQINTLKEKFLTSTTIATDSYTTQGIEYRY